MHGYRNALCKTALVQVLSNDSITDLNFLFSGWHYKSICTKSKKLLLIYKGTGFLYYGIG